jgi:hypothetical protein
MAMAGKKSANGYGCTKERNQRAFLAAYAETGVLKNAAKAAGVTRVNHCRWMKEDPAYAEKFEQLFEQVCERFEAEAIRRAVDGYQDPVYQAGKLVGYRLKYSDTLLMFMLKAMRPEKYREKLPEFSIENNPQVAVYIPDNGRD